MAFLSTKYNAGVKAKMATVCPILLKIWKGSQNNQTIRRWIILFPRAPCHLKSTEISKMAFRICSTSRPLRSRPDIYITFTSKPLALCLISSSQKLDLISKTDLGTNTYFIYCCKKKCEWNFTELNSIYLNVSKLRPDAGQKPAALVNQMELEMQWLVELRYTYRGHSDITCKVGKGCFKCWRIHD